MQACLFSQNPEITAILHQCEGISWLNAEQGMPIPDASLYIWDCEPNCEIPSEILGKEDTQHLLLVDSRNLEAFDFYSSSSVAIMLKPATAFTLRAFVELALKSWSLRKDASEVNTLRRDRDALLQYVLDVNLKLQEYDQERSDFLARALHDLRTPLTALQGYCGLLAQGKLGAVNSRQQELLERMSYSTSRLGRLASGALDLLLQGRLERPPKLHARDISECVDRALHDVYPFLQDKDIQVVIEIDPPQRTFFFEAEQIEQLLVNLLENSCRFTPRRGVIEIHGYSVYWNRDRKVEQAWSEGRELFPNAYRIDILDNGTGVPEHLVDRVFDEYASYSGSLSRSGGGLGLAICKLIATAHHGSIWATARKNGGHFSVILPFSPLRDGPDRARTETVAEYRMACQ
jgi:two-component system, OmpR family, sensor histidine kinase KdpD